MYQVDTQTNSYASGITLATTFFNLFNGKINPLFPARCLMFGHIPDGAWGITIGDIIQLDMHKIIQDVATSNESSDDKILLFNGIILYSLAHELFHLEQNMSIYFKLSQDEDEIRTLIEDSCHCATTNFCNGLKEYNLLPLDFSTKFDYYRPKLDTFTGWDEMDVNRYLQNLNSYYMISDPYQKALWFANGYIMGHFSLDSEPNTLEYDFLRQNHSLIALVYIGEKLYRSGYIAYLNQWSSPRAIMDLINPLILLHMQGFTGPMVLSAAYNENFPGTVRLTIKADVSEPYYWQIVDQLPSDEQPIPPIL